MYIHREVVRHKEEKLKNFPLKLKNVLPIEIEELPIDSGTSGGSRSGRRWKKIAREETITDQ